MAEETDKTQKTEEPTQKRIDEARGKGQVASSREVFHWFMILGATVSVLMIFPSALGKLKNALTPFVASPHAILMDPRNLGDVLIDLAAQIAVALAPFIILLVAMAVFAGVIQNGVIVAVDQIKPKFERLSLAKGFGRLFSARSLTEFAKGLFKLAIVATVATLLVRPSLSGITALDSADVMVMLDFLHMLSVRVLAGVFAVITVIAGLDFLYQKFEHHRNLRMSLQELRDEFKQTEGDPMIKSRLRQIRMERARRRMMSAVPEADVVITNPTHYAVALSYDMDAMDAPRLVAKGIDSLALKIREIATENGVPIVENRPLAQALYGGVELDEDIKPEHYKAVAEVIGYVMRLSGRMTAAGSPN